jgi:hypothetical protein
MIKSKAHKRYLRIATPTDNGKNKIKGKKSAGSQALNTFNIGEMSQPQMTTKPIRLPNG